MKDIRINILAGCLIGIVLFSACSVTKHLPEDEILYTGGKTVIVNKSSTRVGETALTEINAALAKTPSTTLLGGFLPIPFKMWMYNDFVKYKKGFGKWMFNRFAANPPVFISTVNPEVRVKVATNLLRDYGYFNGKVTYETLVDKKDSLKASLLYTVDMKNPYITYDNRYIETLWWLLKQLHKKGLLYKGYTIQPYSPAAGTGLSSHELNQPGCYRNGRVGNSLLYCLDNNSLDIAFKHSALCRTKD